MKQIKCDRCGKMEAAEPMMKGYDFPSFPILKITRQDSIYDTIDPREVDLCKDCRKRLADWLKPLNLNEEACKKTEEIMNRSRGFVRMIERGEIAARKVGREWRIDKDALIAYLGGKEVA